jgi:hypothetical protein
MKSDAQRKIDTFIDRYTPAVAADFRKARAHVRKLFPRGYELAFDNYNAFGCGYSTTSRASGVLISVVAYPRWVTLFFFHGVRLPDPERILEGKGSRIRSVRLEPVSVLDSDAVGELLQNAIAAFAPDLAAAPRLSTVVKTQSARRRPRKPPVKSRQRKAVVRKASRSA